MSALDLVAEHLRASGEPVPQNMLLKAFSPSQTSPRSVRRAICRIHESGEIHIHHWVMGERVPHPAWQWGSGQDAPKPSPNDPLFSLAKKSKRAKAQPEDDLLLEMEDELLRKKKKLEIESKIRSLIEGNANLSPLDSLIVSWPSRV